MPFSRLVQVHPYLIPLAFLVVVTTPFYLAFSGSFDSLPPFTGNPYEASYLRFAAFGDSWASGVNYGLPLQDL